MITNFPMYRRNHRTSGYKNRGYSHPIIMNIIKNRIEIISKLLLPNCIFSEGLRTRLTK